MSVWIVGLAGAEVSRESGLATVSQPTCRAFPFLAGQGAALFLSSNDQGDGRAGDAGADFTAAFAPAGAPT